MNGPIVFLIIWAVFNVLIKSSKDKKKAQNRSRKPGERTNTPSNVDMSQRKNKPQKKNFRQTIEDYKSQIEKEFAMETSEKQKPINKEAVKKKEPTLEEKRKTFREGRFWNEKEEPPINKHLNLEEKRKTFREGRFWKEEEEPEVSMTLIEETEIGDEAFFDIREDILKGVIYSEILDKPKSLQ